MSFVINSPPTQTPRYISAFGGWSPLVDAARSNGTIFLRAFDIMTPTTIDAVAFISGATQTGNVLVGIYRAASNDTATGAVLLGSATQATFGSYGRAVTALTPLNLAPGRYYVALQNELSTDTVIANSSWFAPAGTSMSVTEAYDGSLPATLGAATDVATPLCVAVRRA